MIRLFLPDDHEVVRAGWNGVPWRRSWPRVCWAISADRSDRRTPFQSCTGGGVGGDDEGPIVARGSLA